MFRTMRSNLKERNKPAMIRTYQPADLDRLMQLWLQGNLQAHPFVPASYWEENAADVRRQLPQA